MASAIYILDDQYDLVLSRLYKHELDTERILDNFRNCVGSSISSIVPVVEYDGIHYVWVLHEGVVFVSVSLDNVDVMLVLQFLFKLIELLQNYLQSDHLEKELLQSNYVLIYQLLDEILDYGVPQSTDFSILREYLRKEEKVAQSNEPETEEINFSISRTSTTKISWRPKGIFYKKNEIFIDLIETVSLFYNLETSEVKNNSIVGEINSKCYLSGMPVCKLGLNETLVQDFHGTKLDNKIIFDNINFHQCVELSNLDKNVMQFLPPDGPLKLASYSIFNVSTTNLKPIIVVEPLFKLFHKKDKYKLQISIDIKTFFKKKYLIKDLEIRIPINYKQSSNITKLLINFNKPPKFKCKIGTVILSLDKNLIIWKIPSINGNSSSSIFTNNSRNIDDKYHMISEFEMFSTSELSDLLTHNDYYDKTDNNSLYYSKLKDENSLIHTEKSSSDSISLHFEIPYLSYSGLKIDFLKIIEDQYNFQSFPWVRYLIKTDSYSFKIGQRNYIDSIDYNAAKDNEINEDSINHQ